MRLPTSTGVDCATQALSQQANVFQIVSFLTYEPFFLLIWEFHKHSSHKYSMEVRTADVVSLAIRFFLTVRDEHREKALLSHFPRGGIPLKSSAAEGTSDFSMAFLISLTINGDLWFGHPCRCRSKSKDTALAPSASMSFRRTGSQTPMPRHHWTSYCGACLTLSVSSTPTTHVIKQSSCGDGPAEKAATSESSSLLRRTTRMTFRKDSTNSTRYRADAKPCFTCTCLSSSPPKTLSQVRMIPSLTNPDLQWEKTLS